MIRDEDIFLKSNIQLYDNIASLAGYEGRLKAELLINPYPVLRWDFESLGNGMFYSENQVFEGVISGHEFQVEEAIGSLTRITGGHDAPSGFAYSGSATHARVGNEELMTHRIRFYLPNTICLVRSLTGSLHYKKYHLVYRRSEEPDLNSALPSAVGIGAGWYCSLGDNLSVYLSCTDETEKWLRSPDSYGTLLTARGEVHTVQSDEATESEREGFDFQAVHQKIRNLSWLLSFANGGYLGPLIIATESYRNQIREFKIVGAYRTTPMELLGRSWVSVESDLEQFITCLPTFERMIQVEPWKSVFELVMIWYFQAIQPVSAQEPEKPWPVVANVLGAALELLSVTILSDELGERTGSGADRVKSLLRKIGVLNSNDDERFAKIFYTVRNDATHPRKTGTYSKEDLHLSLEYAKLWVEESLLWRLGYNSGYLRRIPGSTRYSFENPRYDLDTRLPTW